MNVVTPVARTSQFTPFKWDDALRLDDQLSEDERAIRDAAHAYCQDKLSPACWTPTGTSISIARS